MNNKPMAVIGILGYGDRAPTAETLFSLLQKPGVEKILLFWNQPGNQAKSALDNIAESNENISIYVSEENLGSAGGYARLIEYFRDKESSPYLLLLDDDLVPVADCIETLLRAADSRNEHLETTLFLALRPAIPELLNLVKSKLGIPAPRPACCVGFHFMNFISHSRVKVNETVNDGFFSIDFAPWGGLLIPRRALAKLGLPRDDFFLYAEDTELTYRFTRGGGEILLVPDAEISDTEPSWNVVGGDISNLRRRVLVLPDIKVFHEVRNRNFMARHYYRGFLPVYWINKFLFLFSAYVIGLFNGAFSRALLIHQAVNAGELMAAKEQPLK